MGKRTGVSVGWSAFLAHERSPLRKKNDQDGQFSEETDKWRGGEEKGREEEGWAVYPEVEWKVKHMGAYSSRTASCTSEGLRKAELSENCNIRLLSRIVNIKWSDWTKNIGTRGNKHKNILSTLE